MNNIKDISGGTILHAWCWSFNTISENMEKIAAAGYTAVQTSPVSECLVGGGGKMEIYGTGRWYYHYQPTKFVIGNYQLGTRDEFISMCNCAKSHGVAVIVDAVINHCSANYSAIDDSVKNIPGGAFHNPDAVQWGESNRFAETQGFLGGLWDLNTQNPNVQKHLKDFLLDCVACGASGFRYDTAKLIELPDDYTDGYPEYASDFWPYVLQNGAEFQYGEDLQEGGDDPTSSRLAAYAEYMRVTASFYGERLRKAMCECNLSADYLSDYLSYGVSPERLVTWVESHDNYCNDMTYAQIDNSAVIGAWSILAARKGTTPLFFSRPNNSDVNSPWGDNVLGKAGSPVCFDPRVAAVNLFREQLRSEGEQLINPDGNTSAIIINRRLGAVIVNRSDSPLTLCDTPCGNLADGIYTDSVGDSTFTVKDSKITGSVPACETAVLVLS